MTEPTTQPKGVQWRWVGITLLAYIVCYVLPLFAFTHVFPSPPPGGIILFFLGFWMIAGIVIIAGVAGYFSKGITIREPVIASVGLMVAFLAILALFEMPERHISTFVFRGLILTIIVSGLSFIGTWLGEMAQNPSRLALSNVRSVGKATLLYLVFYVVPLLLARGVLVGGHVGPDSMNSFAMWLFIGPASVALAAGFLLKSSPWELSAIAVLTYLLGPFLFYAFVPRAVFLTARPEFTFLVLLFVFLNSLIGGWVGGSVRKFRNKREGEVG